MVLKPNTSYIVVKDFCLFGLHSAIDLVKGQIVHTTDVCSLNELIDVECGPWSSVEVFVSYDYSGLLEEL